MGEILRPNFTNRSEINTHLTEGSLALASYQAGISDKAVLFEATPKTTFQKPREVIASGGFSVEYSTVNEQAVYDDIVSYLLEYRLRVGRFDYSFEFIQDDSGVKIADPVTGESMKNKTERAIWEKRARLEDSSREEADNKGMANLTDEVAIASVGDSIWWASLPGSPKDGFGNYAFIYVGQVMRSAQIRNAITNEADGVRKQISMSAIRVEDPSLAGFNQAYTELTGQNLNAVSPEDFLINPVVASGTTKEILEREIRKKFKVNGGPDEKEWVDGVIADLNPAIRELMRLIKSGTREEKLDAFYTLEKHAAQLRKWRDKGEISDFQQKPTLKELRFAYRDVELESVTGSCPITNKSGNVFESGFEALNKALFGEGKWFNCPKCGYEASGPVGNTCPVCGLTKEDYAAESGKAMCA